MASWIYILVLVFNALIASFAQVLLKKSALIYNDMEFIKQYLNIYVFCGYSLMLLTLFINSILLRYLNVAVVSAFSESLPIVFSLFTGHFLFNESISYKKVIGIIIIIIGIVLVIL